MGTADGFPPNVRGNKRLLGAIVLLAASTLAACAVTTKLQSPLEIKDFSKKSNDAIGLHISAASKQYVWNGNINVIPYSVEFGNALEPNAKHAFGKAFRQVVLIDRFPTPTSSQGGPERAVSLEIAYADVSPGALTFSSTRAVLQLKAILAKGSQIEDQAILVEGSAEASPGVLGAIPLLFINQVAYDAALQEASELAMKDALEKIVEATLARLQQANP